MIQSFIICLWPFLQPHLISHHDAGPVSPFFHPFTGNYLELLKCPVISRLRALMFFCVLWTLPFSIWPSLAHSSDYSTILAQAPNSKYTASVSLWFVEKLAVNGLYLIALITLPTRPAPLLDSVPLLAGSHSSLNLFFFACWAGSVCGWYSVENWLRLPLLLAYVVRHNLVLPAPSKTIRSFCALPQLILNLPAKFSALCIHDSWGQSDSNLLGMRWWICCFYWLTHWTSLFSCPCG